MIDRIKINKIVGELPVEVYTGEGWTKALIQREGAGYKYRYWDKGISYTYYPNSHRLVIQGKLVNLCYEGYNIDTVGDLYFSKVGIILDEEPVYDAKDNITGYEYRYMNYTEGLGEIIDLMNEFLYELLGIREDVRTFIPTQVEFCYNVKTRYVEEYIKMFNHVYSERDPASYKNYIKEENKPLYSSFYIRSNKKYEEDSKAGVTANFYNKLDETEFRLREAADKIRKGERDSLPHQLVYLRSTSDILRLEAIYGRKALYKVREEYGIGNNLPEYIDPKLSRDIIVKRYRHMVGKENLSFFSYQEAKKKIENSNLGREKKLNLIKYIRYHKGACSRNPDSGVYRRRDVLAGLGIHWCLIPREYGIDYLESPIALLDVQLGDLDDVEGIREAREQMGKVEADMLNSITEEEDGTVVVVYDAEDGEDGE